MPDSSPAPIESLIGKIASRYRWQKRFARRIIWKSWPEVAGEAMARHSWPWKFRERDVLLIAVSDSVWMQQLSLQKLAILDALNQLLPPEGMIRDIRFEIGNIEEVRTSHIPASLRNKRKDHAVRHSEAASSDITRTISARAEALTEPVRDAELKKMLQQVYLKSRLKQKEHDTS